MGTRMVSAAESPVHDNYKQLIVDSAETGTVILNRFHKPGFRVLATPYSEAREQSGEQVPMASLDGLLSLYFGGDLDAAFAFGGQVAGRIDAVRPVARDHRGDHRASSTTPLHALAAGVRVVNDRLPALDGLRVLEAVGGDRGRVRGQVAARPGRRGGEGRAVAGRRSRCGTGRRRRPTCRSTAPARCSRSSTAARRASPPVRRRVWCGWADVVDRAIATRTDARAVPTHERRDHRAVRRRRAARRHARRRSSRCRRGAD